MSDQNQQAFPSVIPYGEGRVEWIEGMTLHDWFVGQAMASCARESDFMGARECVDHAFAAADHAMAERKRRAEG